jgi:V/A-type H+/Na+-transporting ATPase subunit C
MVRLSENPEYGFAVGRVRALEAALLTRSQYERLGQAQDGKGFLAALAETGYSKFLEAEEADASQAFDRAEVENLAFLSQYALDRWLLDLFQLPSAFRRLKSALKHALARNEYGVTVQTGFGAAPFGSRVNTAVAAVAASYEQHRDPAAVDVAMDRMVQELLLDIAGASEFLVAYLALHADVENLRTLVRMKIQTAGGGDKREDLASALLPGGTLTLKDLITALPEPWSAVVERFTKGPPYGVGDEVFRGYLERGTAAVVDKRTFVRMERYGREVELGFLRQTRYATFGHEPLVAFFLFHENEVRNLRQLYAAKLAGVTEEVAQDLVAYVE